MKELQATRAWRAAPGLVLCAGLAAVAFRVRDASWVKEALHLGPLLLVILVGMLWRTVAGLPAGLEPGVQMAKKPILRWGVAGLGFRLSLPELWKVGAPALGVVVISTAAALGFGLLLARRLGISEKLGMLLSVGGAVCGASAVIAADTVVQGEKKDSAYAVGIITALGTAGIVLYPLLHHAFGMSEGLYALWDGASLPEMAQVVAAGDMVSAVAAEQATVVKLARISLLAPVVFLFAWWLRARHQTAGEAKVPIVPWFLGAFLASVVLASTGWLGPAAMTWLQQADLWLLCVGMAAVGLQTSFAELRAAGPAPFLVGAFQWLFLSALSLGLGWAVLRG